ncbi:MAG: adenylate kinase [Sumerlaeia bacterium]
MNLVLFGPPGSGKGTQSSLLCETYGLRHLSTGDAFRAAIRAGTPLGRDIKTRIEQGELVSDELTAQLVRGFVKQGLGEFRGYLFDGFPRTIPQVGLLDDILKEAGLAGVAVVNLDVPKDTLILRITGRRVCLDCKRTINVYFKAPSLPDQCDFRVCPFTQRVDDQPATVQERLRVYDEQTKPVLMEYELRGQLANIDGTGNVDSVFRRIKNALADFNMNAGEAAASPEG